MNKLQKALRANALFSSLSGAAMILFNKQLAELFGTDNNAVFWIVGLILIYFAITIWYEISKQRRIAVLWIVTQDFVWVTGSLILILLNPFEVSSLGNVITGVIAAIVLFMGINQAKALSEQKATANQVY